nr:reverse transcriptase domain-containing protein [Tanacetum cinerariifolium]
MSTNEQTPLSQPMSVVRNTLGREQALQNLVRPVPEEDLREYYDKNYHQILPIIAEKLHQEKVQQEKLKAVKARLNFEEASQYSESETPNRRRNLKERLGPRGARTRSISPEQRRGHSKSPKEKGLERRTMFKRLEKGLFHRLGDKEKNVSAHSRGSEQKSYYSSRRETESCYQSSRSKETEIASEKHRHKREYSRRMEVESESEGSARGHMKSKPKKQKSSMEDDLSQLWVCEEMDPFTPRIRYFDFPKTQMPSHIKTYDESEDPEDHLKIFQAVAKMKRWAMPTWCHMFNSTLTENARVWFDDLHKESIDSYDDLKKAFRENYLQRKKCIKDLVEIHNIKQRNGESTEAFVRRGEMAASNRERKKSFPSWKQETRHKQNFKRGNFWNEQRLERKQDRFTLLTKTPREILALDKGKFKPPPPMTTLVEKRNAS